MHEPRIGTAGWSIPKRHAAAFPPGASHLARYAGRLNAVEINTSFYRPHRRTTYQRWAASVPADFRFAVKVPQEITHRLRLTDATGALDAFLEQVAGLGGKLGPLLFQLPPSFAFDQLTAETFFALMRKRYGGLVVCEPRHASWFVREAEDLLKGFEIGRVATDPAVIPAAAEPGGFAAIGYFRLHGAPRIYYSDYAREQIDHYAVRLAAAAAGGRSPWCIFDNTTLGAASGNALMLAERLRALSIAGAANP